MEKLSTPERDLLRDGFLARTSGEELPCPDMEVRVLWSFEDVTNAVEAAAAPETTPAGAQAARKRRMSELEAESEASTGLQSRAVTLYTEEGRAVAVDVRAILSALRQVYDAAELADEIEGRAGP